jgi:hypothetical protein
MFRPHHTTNPLPSRQNRLNVANDEIRIAKGVGTTIFDHDDTTARRRNSFFPCFGRGVVSSWFNPSSKGLLVVLGAAGAVV